jgi:hypothetical protein
MEPNAQVKTDGSIVRHIVWIIPLLALGALGACASFSGRTSDDRPPIIVQGGSADIQVLFEDATYNTKGEWMPIGSSGKHRHEHPADEPKTLDNTVVPSTGCSDYKAVRTGDLTFTLASKTNSSQTWTFDVRIDGPHLVVDPVSSGVMVRKHAGEPWRLTVTVQTDPMNPATEVPTNLTAVEPRGNPAKKCTFTDKPTIEIVQKSN